MQRGLKLLLILIYKEKGFDGNHTISSCVLWTLTSPPLSGQEGKDAGYMISAFQPEQKRAPVWYI